jgi:hypothetical protein
MLLLASVDGQQRVRVSYTDAMGNRVIKMLKLGEGATILIFTNTPDGGALIQTGEFLSEYNKFGVCLKKINLNELEKQVNDNYKDCDDDGTEVAQHDGYVCHIYNEKGEFLNTTLFHQPDGFRNPVREVSVYPSCVIVKTYKNVYHFDAEGKFEPSATEVPVAGAGGAAGAAHT